jgi:hypothetical protein
MEAADPFHLLLNVGQCPGQQGHRAVFLAFAIMHCQEPSLQIEAVDAKVDALG